MRVGERERQGRQVRGKRQTRETRDTREREREKGGNGLLSSLFTYR